MENKDKLILCLTLALVASYLITVVGFGRILIEHTMGIGWYER
jgi:hypothetical protein